MIIAASNSIDVSRADYQCDGTADEVEIQSAVNALRTDKGGKILLLEGTYNIAAAISITGNDDNITIQGTGKGTVIKVANNTLINAFYFNNVSGVTVKDLVIDGNKANQTDGGSTYNQCGIYANGGLRDACFENIVMKNCYYRGFMGRIIQRALFFNCSFIDNGNRGLMLDGPSSTSVSTDNKIVNCTFSGNGSDGLAFGEYAFSTYIGGCISRNNGLFGIYVESGGPSETRSAHMVIEGCIVSGNSSRGVNVSYSNYVTVSNCHIYDNSGDGILYGAQSSYCTVTGSSITGNSGYGITYTSGSNRIVVGNVVKGNVSGQINLGATEEVYHNIVS